ncbi:PHD finger protein Alfin1-like [Gymnodraco acuticeps]|uniref:PHD finger protein Alfin1-like n=1 Tax=Gymnodraco acuticeps TaxID=8218 RepID=A0A6P8VEH4_GYMAC|nr:PHD finger protein Alfin1-like [Gymnodraco acuticeps]
MTAIWKHKFGRIRVDPMAQTVIVGIVNENHHWMERQHEGVPTVYKFAEKILLGEAIEFETSQKAVHELRLDIATSLLRESDDLSRLCFYCGMEEQDEEHWICCDICQRWYHHQCVQRPPVDKPYLCPGCT